MKKAAVAIAAGAMLALSMWSCVPPKPAAPAPRPAQYHPVSAAARDGADGFERDGAQLFSDARSPIGIDYAPEARCADEDPGWHSGRRPHSCQPQLGEDERTCGNSMAKCPSRCLGCYSDDLEFIRRDLHIGTITIYHPNYYVLKAARRAAIKVIAGLLNDSVLGLAAPAARTDCTYGGAPFPLCGSRYADALIDGVCNGHVGGDPFSLCSSGVYLAPLNNPLSGEFLRDGTVIGIQLGNEFFQACEMVQVPGLGQPCCSHSRRTGRCNAWVVTREVYSAAARTLRAALDRRGLAQVKISVALVEKQGRTFCRNGAPPPGVDLIAAHPYCDFVAEMPALWTTLSGAQCWQQARYEKFPVDQQACGADRTYIGETGYNTGCPLIGHNDALLAAGQEFVGAMIADQPSCKGQPNPTAPFPNSLFEFSDTCPPGGCLAGCGDPRQCSYECCCKHHCTGPYQCAASCPPCLGNGYFGLYHTPGYATAGFPLEPKFNPTPSLLCPESNQ